MAKIHLLFILILFICSCEEQHEIKDPIRHALTSDNPKIKYVMDSLEQYEVQIKLSQIKRNKDSISFVDHEFQVDDNNYFYPASTVKFPIAILALEKLNNLDPINMHTRFYVEGDSIETTFAQDISKIFAISDNEANNRLFEFLGQDAINSSLVQKGITPVRISHRLSTDNAQEITTNPLVIYQNDSTTTTLNGTINTSAKPLELAKIEKGNGFYAEDSLYREAFSFALKNHYPINSQHAILKRIIFPEKFNENEQFDISDSQREFVLKAMHTLPKELGFDPIEYYDSYVKFFIFGDIEEPMPDHIKIYNKVGYAYGTLTDCAYIFDSKNNIEFMLTATILVNKDGVFNDNVYEYDEIGIPFLAQLGREIYSQELKRSER